MGSEFARQGLGQGERTRNSRPSIRFSRAATPQGSMEAPESALQHPAFFPFLVKIVTIGHNLMPSGAARANLRGLF